MILTFSSLLFLILLLCIIICYKYFFRKKILVNAVLDFFTGIIILFLSTDFFTNKVPYSNVHGGSLLLDLLNFIFFPILYIISTVALYWKRSKKISILIPAGLYITYIMFVFFSFEFADIFQRNALLSLFLVFFPIYIYNYFQVFVNNKNVIQ